MRRGIVRASIAALAGIAAVVATATPAQAASSQCFVGTSGDCTTAIIGAHGQGHFVDYVINNRGRIFACPYRIVDVNSGAWVRWGTVTANTRLSDTLYNVYGFYRLELRGCQPSTTGILENNK